LWATRTPGKDVVVPAANVGNASSGSETPDGWVVDSSLTTVRPLPPFLTNRNREPFPVNWNVPLSSVPESIATTSPTPSWLKSPENTEPMAFCSGAVVWNSVAGEPTAAKLAPKFWAHPVEPVNVRPGVNPWVTS
jgi:hypothetical protein